MFIFYNPLGNQLKNLIAPCGQIILLQVNWFAVK